MYDAQPVQYTQPVQYAQPVAVDYAMDPYASAYLAPNPYLMGVGVVGGETSPIAHNITTALHALHAALPGHGTTAFHKELMAHVTFTGVPNAQIRVHAQRLAAMHPVTFLINDKGGTTHVTIVPRRPGTHATTSQMSPTIVHVGEVPAPEGAGAMVARINTDNAADNAGCAGVADYAYRAGASVNGAANYAYRAGVGNLPGGRRAAPLVFDRDLANVNNYYPTSYAQKAVEGVGAFQPHNRMTFDISKASGDQRKSLNGQYWNYVARGPDRTPWDQRPPAQPYAELPTAAGMDNVGQYQPRNPMTFDYYKAQGDQRKSLHGQYWNYTERGW